MFYFVFKFFFFKVHFLNMLRHFGRHSDSQKKLSYLVLVYFSLGPSKEYL